MSPRQRNTIMAWRLVLAIACPVALLAAFFGAGHARGQSAFVADTRARAWLTMREAVAVLAAPSALIGVMVTFALAPVGLNILGAAILARWGRDPVAPQ